MSEPRDGTDGPGDGLLSRAMLLAWLVRVLMGCAGALLFVLPRLLTQAGIPASTAGLIMATYQLAMLGTMVVGGEVLHRRGPRFTLWVGGVCAVAGCSTYLLGEQHVAFYFLARALHGTGAALVMLTLQGLVMTRATRGTRGRAMGLANLPDFLMLAVSPMIAEALMAANWTRGIFVLSATICLAPLASAALMPPARDAGHPPSLLHAPMAWNRLEWLGMTFGFVGGFAIQFGIFMAPLVTGRSAGWGFSAFFLAYGVTAILGRITFEPRWHGARSPIPLLCFSLAICASTAAMSLARHPAAFALLGGLQGLGHGMYYPTLVQMLTQHIPAHRLMVRVGRLQSLSLFGAVLAPPLAGALARRFGQGPALLTGAAIGLGAFTLLLLAIRRNLRHHRPY